jgi:hypothetical protein
MAVVWCTAMSPTQPKETAMKHVIAAPAHVTKHVSPKKRRARPFGRAITNHRFHPPCLGD